MHLAVFTLALFSTVALSSCQPAAPDTNRNATAPTAEAQKETPNPAAIEAEILRLEREWAGTIKTHDTEVVRRIEADDIVITYPDGTTGTKETDIKDLESKALNADSWDVVDAKVMVLDADAAVVTGRSLVKNGKYKRPDGKSIDISGEYRFTDVFARRNGRWQVVASQATKIENPTAAPAPPAPAASPAAKASVTKAASPAASKTP